MAGGPRRPHSALDPPTYIGDPGGYWTRSSRRVFCFEPDPRACKKFKVRHDDRRVSLFELAIANSDGRVTFHMSDGVPPTRDPADYPEGWDASGSIRAPKKHVRVAKCVSRFLESLNLLNRRGRAAER